VHQDDTLNESRDILESAIAQSMTVYGVSPSVGRIYSVLFFTKTPMTLKEIQDHVAMSKASVSNGVRELMDTEMVSKIWKKGQRQDHYIAEKDFFRNFIVYFVKMMRQENHLIKKAVEHSEPLLQELSDELEDTSGKEELEEDLQLLQHAKDYLEWTMRIANAMDSGDIFNYFPKPTSEEKLE